ncbi:hypothetical protein OH76DRAFT_1397203 [Lentinus brumalis]|uniref:Uncharacterized protein n=1 Tax=Lentinus brumalis TaxID=2498619 RepID=A0A371DQW7_9APHY|nr:hypothetical protein OH76DRAFT_1397203 [Polyporus brumalis]
MPQRGGSLPPRSRTHPPPERAASTTSSTTPLVPVPQRAASAPTANTNEKEAPWPTKILPADCVVRPVSRWWGPLRKNFPQHHLYQGVKYWEKGFADIKFVVENYVDWRERPEIIHLVEECETFVLDLAAVRERLDLQECISWKRKVRTFMVNAETSSQQAQAGGLRTLLHLAASHRSPSGALNHSSVRSDDHSGPLRVRAEIEPRVPVFESAIIDATGGSQGPFADHLADTSRPVNQDADVQLATVSTAGDSIEMVVYNATAAWVEATASAGSERGGARHQRTIRRVSSFPSL